jgi:lipoprotein-anchoring transpeptidase ErfK/SrfK
MRKYFWVLAIVFTALVASSAARAEVVAEVNLSGQRMTVSVDGFTRYSWPVSTARRGYTTPTGTYRPIRLERTWYSRKYHMSPMPYAIFFLGGYAIHGTNESRSLGMPVSHGCVRLNTANARTLFHLVEREGRGNTRIVISGYGPIGGAPQIFNPFRLFQPRS